MRYLLVVALLAACERAPQSTPPRDPPKVRDAAASSVDSSLADALVALRPKHVIYLDGVGWLMLKTYVAYHGKNPRTGEPVDVPAKTLVFYLADPELDAVLDGHAPVHDASKPDRERWLAALEPRGSNDDDDDLDVPEAFEHPPGVDVIARDIRERLLAGTSASVRGVGEFSKWDRGRRVRFTVSEELRARLDRTRP